jgi:hypothetical protein
MIINYISNINFDLYIYSVKKKIYIQSKYIIFYTHISLLSSLHNVFGWSISIACIGQEMKHHLISLLVYKSNLVRTSHVSEWGYLPVILSCTRLCFFISFYYNWQTCIHHHNKYMYVVLHNCTYVFPLSLSRRFWFQWPFQFFWQPLV